MSEMSLHDRLRALGLIASADSFDDIVSLATKKRWGVAQIFEHIVDIEERDRTRRGWNAVFPAAISGNSKRLPTRLELADED